MKGFEARAWLAWVAGAAVLAMIARNPLYSLLLLLAARLVSRRQSLPGAGLSLPWGRLTLMVLSFSASFNALFVHTGQTILWRLPASWPLVGGPLTLEAAVAGAGNGLVLLALLAVFGVLNAVVPAHELVRLSPRALRDVGVVVLIAMTYVPETSRALQSIREAQAIRGHRLRGLRDWQPLVIPLLVGGLERAMGLAEAMVARGYGATAGREQSPWLRAGMLLGLLGLLGGWFLAVWLGWPGWLLLLAGALLILALVWRSGRAVPGSRYRPRRWRRADWLLPALVLLPLALALLPGSSRETLAYLPYPQLHWPSFDPWLGLSLALLALPAFWRAAREP